MPRKPEGGLDAWRVFVSSTDRDLHKYRLQIQAGLLHRAKAVCFLSQDWPGHYESTVAKCREELNAAGGFILLLGRWYGSVPPQKGGRQKSITYMEFDWAQQRWKNVAKPPVAVLEPEPGSPAYRELDRRARELLDESSAAFRRDHDSLLRAFHSRVKDSWDTVQFFHDLRDARELAIVSCLFWRGESPRDEARKASQAEATRRPSLGDEQLGMLGRDSQLRAVQLALSDLRASSSPAAAFLASGNEDAGLRAFLAHLASGRLFDGEPRTVRPDSSMKDLALLTASIARQLGFDDLEIQTPRDLAKAVEEELRNQPLLLFIERVPGGIAAFHADFWTPFLGELKSRAKTTPTNRIVMIAADFSGAASPGQPHLCGPDFEQRSPDYEKLLLLPSFGPFRKSDILTWLDQLKVDPARRAAIAEGVLQDGDGNPDSVPLHVFERLRHQELDIPPEET